jgi:cob(I)alamin adenosyltransferase
MCHPSIVRLPQPIGSICAAIRRSKRYNQWHEHLPCSEGGGIMGNRLSKIYTRTGDDGTTGLGDGSRVDKESLRVEAYGTVDETNSAIGLVLSAPLLPPDIGRCLTEVQHDLFSLGGELCIPGHVMITAAHVDRLERELDAFNESLPPLKEFILPGGGPAAAACHLARTICRRAERRCWSLARVETVAADSLKYLNRLSDLLFVLARVLARQSPGGEVIWRR